jgi:hypothetical protein
VLVWVSLWTRASYSANLLGPLAPPVALCDVSILAVLVLLAARLVCPLFLLLGLLALPGCALSLVYTDLLDVVLVDGLRWALINSDIVDIEVAELLVHLVIVQRLGKYRFVV